MHLDTMFAIPYLRSVLQVTAALCAFSLFTPTSGKTALLLEAEPLDNGFLFIHISDGEVIHHEGSQGDQVIRYSPELDTTAATTVANWIITSDDDRAYGTAGRHPTHCYRKKKMNGHAQFSWNSSISDYNYEYTYEHWLYLEMPSPLQQGASYHLEIDDSTNINDGSADITFDIFSHLSEAIHVNIVGCTPDAPHKAADLYAWMGNGGQRDYSSFTGNTVYAYNVDSGEKTAVGAVSFWMAQDSTYGWTFNLTASDIWTADFSTLTTPGTYRLAIEGVGASQEFTVAEDIYKNPFITSLRGYFYMRIGEENPKSISPPPRTPLLIPGKAPAQTTVYLTDMTPYHTDWSSISGDAWDKPSQWAAYVQSGSPTNPQATGGHSDAADLDRHLKHVVNIYDLLLPYLMTGGAIDDDNTGITESDNGIPDIIDEARYEVDFWLNLRDGEGYSHGLTNPTSNYILYQAGKTPMAAWANAANAAMLAEAFRIQGNTTLMTTYRDAAIEAYTYASGLSDQMLDDGISEDDSLLRGRDLKMMAAAYLYNITGDTTYEDAVYQESICANGCAGFHLAYQGIRNQLYGTAAYLTTPRQIHYQTMYEALQAQIIREAKEMEADYCDTRPSRRGTDQYASFWQAAHLMDRTIIAHAVTQDADEKTFFRKAMELEVSWGLGRNPMNIIQMTTATSPLTDKRSLQEAYTSGRWDGIAGVHPGHTPFINLQDWSTTMTMGQASKLYANAYPEDVLSSTWPHAEAYFPSRYVYSHNEFTPRQTMRGKMALYGYLWGLGKQQIAASPFPWNLFLPAIRQKDTATK